jgi:alkylation response protein AidB-like acyl-CoA dehydrogenase
MTDFSLDLNEDQLQIQKWVHDFAAEVVRPAGPEWDQREETPWPVIQEAANIGLYSWEFIANAFADPTGLTFPIVSEELCWGDAGIALAIFGTTLGVSGIVGNGTPEQVAEWVPQCFGTPDDIHVASFAVSEPDAGSDVSSLRTRAVYDEAKDEWVLNGTKTWITNGGIDKVPNVHVVVAAVDPALKARGHASFVVPPGTPGLSMGQKFSKMGIRASHTAEVVLDDVRVPGRCLLGGKEKLDARLARARDGKSSRVQAAMSTFEASRPLVGAQALGIARAAYEYALDYAKERRAFGRAIIENQAIAFKLADMKMHIDAARLLVWRACWMGHNGKQFTAGEGSMSKLYAGEVAVKATEEAIQILGGAGYVKDHPVEQWHRDSKIYTIFEGTSEIQRLVVARAISGVHIP